LQLLAGFTFSSPGRSFDINKTAAWVVSLGLLLFLVYLIVQLVAVFQSSPEENNPVQMAQVKTPEADKTSGLGQQAADISQWHLFGKVEPVAPTKAEKMTNAPDTKLKLTLRGIYFPNQSEGSIAIIQEPGKLEKPFAIGDSIFGLATLEQVHIDRVIILRDEQHETLRLPIEALDLDFTEDARVVASKAIQQFRNDLLTGNMDEYLFNVDYDTVYDDNGFAGFKVIGDSEKGRELLSKVGMEDGDIVTKIDGIDLSKDPNMINALQNLRTAEHVDIVIKRGDTTINLSLDFTQK